MDTPKERPILFSGPMVRALRNGHKTQTRRIIKPQPAPDQGFLGFDKNGYATFRGGDFFACPYGRVGERLWVRETFNYYSCDCYEVCNHSGWVYKADLKHWDDDKWRPSIHMPRAASRILLEITDRSVERLNDISEQDCIQEGIDSFRPVPGDGPPDTFYRVYDTTKWTTIPNKSYKSLWQSINGPDSWDLNPWVWVITFKILESK